MIRHIILFAASILITLTVTAQKTLTAHVYENNTRIAISGATVNNISNNEITVTDDRGTFHITAKKGDILVIKAFAYKTDSLLLVNLKDMEIFLEPKSNELKQVNVTSTELKSDLNLKDPEFHGQSLIYQRDSKGNLTGGVIFRVWYWKKQDKKLKKEADRLKNEQTREEIFRVFNPGNLSQFLPLKGKEMDAFIIRYIPDVSTYNAASFNLLAYLNASYKEFNSLSPEEKKPQRLDN
jgi:hypothetical protein